MQLQVTKPGTDNQDYRFTRGPIYIGRHQDCHIQLTGKMVSRQHAVIFITLEGGVVLKDLDSANGTFVNCHPVREHPLENGDRIQIGEFHIAVDLSDELTPEDNDVPDDTAFENSRQAQIITRDHPAQQGPDIILPITRGTDFARASRALCSATCPPHCLQTLLMILLQQFRASRVWCSLRADSRGRDAYAMGTTERGLSVNFEDLELRDEIKQVLETGQFLLVPNTAEDKRVRIPFSAMIAPLLQWHERIGIIYLDRNADWKPFGLGDLDYLMLLAIQTGAILGAGHHQPSSENVSESQT